MKIIRTVLCCIVIPSFRHSTHCRHCPPSASIYVRENNFICNYMHTQQLRQQKLFCCRPSGVDGTHCHHICGGTWTTDISSMHWKYICLGYSRPRRIVTNMVSCALEAYLLTYLLVVWKSSTLRWSVVISGVGHVGLCLCWVRCYTLLYENLDSNSDSTLLVARSPLR